MNLHETLTTGRSNAHAVPVAFREKQWATDPAPPASPLMTVTRRHLSFLIVTAVLGALMLLPSGALAATAANCDASAMIDAAANSRQISAHSTGCYRQALADLPPDLDSYAPLVRHNLLKAMWRDAGLESQTTGNKRALQSLPAVPSVAAGVRGPVTSLLEGLGPAHVDQVPVPVLALGGAAGLLLLAGLGTSLSRVRQRRAAR
jgi:hypothetical protein